jgi:hypothetical protein
MTMTGKRDPWGPYRGTIDDHLATCSDYLGRLKRSAAGDIAPERHYFNEKARWLLDAASQLVRRGQDVERWLNDCGSPVGRSGEGEATGAGCARPSSHPGNHDDDPPPTPAERAAAAGWRLVDHTGQVAQQLGWAALAVDTGTATGRRIAEEARESLREAAAALERIAANAQSLAGEVRSVELSLDDLRPSAATEFDGPQHIGPAQPGGLGL